MAHECRAHLGCVATCRYEDVLGTQHLSAAISPRHLQGCMCTKQALCAPAALAPQPAGAVGGAAAVVGAALQHCHCAALRGLPYAGVADSSNAYFIGLCYLIL
jgi:hypothetical protein